MNRHVIVTFAATALALSACGPSNEELAKSTLSEATRAFEQHDYTTAKTLLDSVIYSYPKERKTKGEANELLRKIDHIEQEENLAYLDSLLAVREKETQQYLRMFTIEDEHVEVPSLIHKHQTARMAFDRSYLRAQTDTKGNFYLASHFTGESHINHYAVRVQMGDEYTQTDTVTNEAMNHSFDDGGQVWEVVKYKNDTDNGTAAFIAHNFDKRLVVTFITPRHSSYKILLTETDKKAIRDTYYLSLLLRETEQTKAQIATVKKALARSNEHILLK